MYKKSWPVLRWLPLVTISIAHSATAHHSYAMFDMVSSRNASGTLYSLEWKNPHSWIWVAIPNDRGGTDIWGFEGGGSSQFARQGLNKDNLKLGTKITVEFHPLKDGRNGGSFISMTLEDGRVIR